MPDALPSRASPAAAVPRGWRALLTGRWHRSSWVVAALVLLFLVFCNVPGQVSEFDLGRNIYDFDGLGLVQIPGYVQEHGWPLAWARRDSDLSPLSSSLPTDMNCWKPWENQPQYSFRVLPLNALVAVAIALAAAVGFELWRRGRSKWYQLHLRDALAVTFIVALPGAWYADQQRRHAREESVLREHYTGPFESWESGKSGDIMRVDRKVGGITWLRKLIGHKYFESLDRVVSVRTDGEGLQWAAELPDVRLVIISGKIRSSDFHHLAGLPHLESLDVRGTNVDDHAIENLIGLKNLRQLDLSFTSVSADGIPYLAQMKQLRLLTVSAVGFTAADQKQLRAELPECRVTFDPY